MLKIPRLSDVTIALFVFAIAILLLIPIPTFILDILITINLGVGFVLLLVAIYMPNALSLLVFPSLLLLTTLFRLGLNVASARLILVQADAGRVIESFGTFLISGEIAVGIIIFAIITVVNYLVIAKGSARVSEVAARFALDALPGKQGSIDSDLRAGLVSPEQAQAMREELRKESQLFGAMDGAMKFVQGDAIAGIFIIFVNMIGGMYIGISRGMSVAEATETYLILTVGDGLVSQIPAILISICSGIIVTRVSSGEAATLGSDVGAQLFSRPGALLVASVLLILVGLVPGLPLLPFSVVGLSGVGLALILARTAPESDLEIPSSSFALPALPPVRSLPPSPGPNPPLPEEDIELASLHFVLDAEILFPFYETNRDAFLSWLNEFKDDFYMEFGIQLPPIVVSASTLAAPCSYSLILSGTMFDEGAINPDRELTELSPEGAIALGLEPLAEEDIPLGHNKVCWVKRSNAHIRILTAAGIRHLNALNFLVLKAAAFLQQHPEEVVTITNIHYRLKALERKHPGLLEQTLQRELIDVSRLTEICQDIVRDGLNIRDLRQVVEQAATYCSNNRALLGSGEEFDRNHLMAFIRTQRKRQLLARLLSHRRTLKVFTLTSEVEDVFDRSDLESGFAPLAIEPRLLEALLMGLQDLLHPIKRYGIPPISILCRSEIRPKIVNFLRTTEVQAPVLAFDELEPGIDLEQLGIWGLREVQPSR